MGANTDTADVSTERCVRTLCGAIRTRNHVGDRSSQLGKLMHETKFAYYYLRVCEHDICTATRHLEKKTIQPWPAGIGLFITPVANRNLRAIRVSIVKKHEARITSSLFAAQSLFFIVSFPPTGKSATLF